MVKIGIADTTFSRVDLFAFVEEQLSESNFDGETERYTVSGVKDLPIACKLLFEKYNCDIVLALGMPGAEKIDKTCSHEASTSIQQVQLLVNKHILEVFIHMDEAKDEKELFEISKDRTKKHTLNALELLKSKTALSPFAGKGRRQGFADAGQVSYETSEEKLKLGLVVSEYNKEITFAMEKTVLQKAEELKAEIVKKIYVPGFFDSPLAVKKLLEKKEIQGVVVLAAVIKGDTSHDELVAFTAAEKISELSLKYNKPVTLGVCGPRATKEDAVKRIIPYSERAVEGVIKLIRNLEAI